MRRKSSALFFVSFQKVFIRHSRNRQVTVERLTVEVNVPVAVSHYSFVEHEDSTKSG